MAITVKHSSEKASHRDGQRILVERTWPRGISKQRADISSWLRDLGPSEELARWMKARPTMWPLFRKRYLCELSQPAADLALQQLYRLWDKYETITLVFSCRDRQHNNAVVLKELLEGMRKPPTSSGPLKAPAVAMRARRSRR